MNNKKKALTKSKRCCFASRCALFFGLFCMVAILQPSWVAASKVIDRIVAVVNDDIIVLQELNELLKPYEAQMRVSGYLPENRREMVFEMRQTILNQLIDQKLIEQAAKETLLGVEEKDIDSNIERIKEANRLTDEEFREALKQQGLDMETLRKNMRSQILASRLETVEIRRKIVITQEETKAYYEKHADQYAGEDKYHLRNILMKVSSFDDVRNKEAVYQTMQHIVTEFENGKSFESLAKTYSESPFAQEGGELGTFGLDDLSPNLRKAVEKLAPGNITSILETTQGYQILYLQEIIQTSGIPFEEARGDIEKKLYEEQYQKRKKAWIERLRKQAHIRLIQ